MTTRSTDTTVQKERPLSPHLQVWRWHPTMASSILHRASGTANYIGAGLLVLFLVCLSGGQDGIALVEPLFTGPLGWITRLVIFALTLSYSYHWLNGLRHLIWDAGFGFGPKSANRNSWLIFAATPVLAIAIWILALGVA